MLQYGAGARWTDRHGWTPLHDAAHAGSSACSEMLIRAGARVDARATNPPGLTPIDAACATADSRMLELISARSWTPDCGRPAPRPEVVVEAERAAAEGLKGRLEGARGIGEMHDMLHREIRIDRGMERSAGRVMH